MAFIRMNSSLARAFFSALVFFCYTSLRAEEPEGPARTCRVLFINKPQGAPDHAYIFDGSESHRVTLSGLTFSTVVNLPNGPIRISLSPNEINAPEELPIGLPSLNIQESTTDLYILVSSDPSNALMPIRLNPVNVDKSQLQVGETLWINMTKHNVFAKFPELEVAIPSMQKTVSEAPLDDHGYYKAHFIYQRNGEGKYAPVMRKDWWFDANSRYIGFIVDKGGRLPRIFTIRDKRVP